MVYKLTTRIRECLPNVWSRYGVCVAALLLVFLAFAPPTRSAPPSVVGCRSDPVIIFKNGQSLRIVVKIGAAARQVDSIEYTVHVPPKAKIQRIIYSGGKLKHKEKIVIQYDAPPRTYAVETVVHSQVEASVKLTAKFRDRFQSVQGWNEQLLSVTLEP